MLTLSSRYAGIDFATDQEARWAVFFMELELEWQYFRNGIPFGSAQQFGTPACFLICAKGSSDSPQHGGAVVLIRPLLLHGAEIEFGRQLAINGQREVMICCGVPTDDLVHRFTPDGVYEPPHPRGAERRPGRHGWDENEVPGMAWWRFCDDDVSQIIDAGSNALDAQVSLCAAGA